MRPSGDTVSLQLLPGFRTRHLTHPLLRPPVEPSRYMILERSTAHLLCGRLMGLPSIIPRQSFDCMGPSDCNNLYLSAKLC